MGFVQNLIRRLYPHKIITRCISDLNNQFLEHNSDKNDLCISIENENKTRQFCCLAIDELTTLLGSCPVSNRTLYACISS